MGDADLTDADRDYARRWAAARGLAPAARPWRAGDVYAWTRYGPGPVPFAVAAYLPASVYSESEPEAWDALAVALGRVREDLAAPGGIGPGAAVADGLVVRHDEAGGPDEVVLHDPAGGTAFHAEALDDDLLWFRAERGGRAVVWNVRAELGPGGRPRLSIREDVE